MSDRKPDPGREPDDIFVGLADRPTPELDSEGLWRRVEAGMEPRGGSLWNRMWAAFAGTPAPLRLAYAAVGFAAVGLVVWTGLRGFGPSETPQFVLLTPADDGAPEQPGVVADSSEVRLEVRLVRGYDGAPPEDVVVARAQGAGGADALADVRDRIAALLPFAEFGVVGRWDGAVEGGDDIDVELSSDYRLVARAANPAGQSALRLDDLELEGAASAATGDMNLESGRLYILGVVSPGAEAPDLVLLIRAVPVVEEGR